MAFNGMAFDSDRRILYIFQELRGSKISNEKLGEMLEPWKEEFIICDSAEPKSISDLKAYGYYARGAKKGPGSLEYSMKWLASLAKIVIDPQRCPYTMDEFSTYEYEQDKDGNYISSFPDGNDHHISAVRYAMESYYKIKDMKKESDSMLQNIFLWLIEHIFKIKTQTTPDVVSQNNDYQREYERIDQINFTSIFANKLSNYVANDSNIDVIGTSERAKYFNEIAQSMKRKLKKISSTILGVGGIAIVPYVKKGKIYYNIVPQNRILIDEKTGDLITGATILAESKVVSDLVSQKIYYRWTNYQIRNNNLIIQQKFTDENGNELKDTPEFWAGVQTILSISNVDRVPFAFVISPVNNRKPSDDYGVPITYGCDETIA